jgi:predicted permease
MLSRVLDSIRQDVVYALRGFRRSRGFTLVALLVLAFGIAANTTIFSVVNAVLLRPLPVAQPETLRFLSVVFTREVKVRGYGVPPATLEQLAQRTDVFGGVAGFFSDTAKLGTGLSATRVVGERVTTGYFDVLGVHAALGRTFAPADDLPGAEPVIVISDRFWRTKLDANPNVIGTTVDLRSPYTFGGTYYRHHRVYTVVGVMPPAFKGVSTVWVPSDYWVPLRQRASDLVESRREMSGRLDAAAVASFMEGWTRAIAIVRPLPGASGATVAAAAKAAEQELPETAWATSGGVRREKGTIVVDRSLEGRLPFDPAGAVVPERLAAALMLVPVLVMLIATANLAGILMARGVARRGEIGVRLALGAGRGRMVRQMMTESLLLSLAGAAAAIALSRGFIKLVAAFMPRFAGVGGFNLAAVSLDLPLDGRVLLFTILLGIVVGVLVGMTPALQALRTDVLAVLAGTAQAASPRSRFRRWILVPQICFSIVLLLAAGVLVRALLRAEFADRGFDPSGVVYAELARPPRYSGSMTPQQRQAENARQKAEYLHLLQQVRTVPGVEIAALANKTVWTNQDNVAVVTRESYREGQKRWAAGAHVSDGYFEAMRLPIVRGRAFDTNDTVSSPPVAIICEELARLLWPDAQGGLGEYVANPDPATTTPPTWLRVVGIARAVKVPGGEDRPKPFLYLPIAQRPSLLAASILARGRGNTAELLKTLPAAIVAAQRDAEIPRARTIAEDIGEALYPTRLAATVLAVSGLFGLLLSVVGLYGVVSYSAAQRMREIGIRCALGAERRDLLALLLRDAVVALAVAVVIGVGLGFAAVRIVSSMVVALPRLDAVTMIAIPLTLSAVILAACLRPVRRATRVNPIDVLRAL